ncbi:MAG: hypothetical protein AABW49_02420 [Nanoarchaeota archaeon]
MKFSDKLFIPGIIILIGHFFYRLIDQSQMLKVFPLDYTNDWASHIAKIFFLENCGFFQYCEYWYNGFTLFELYPPGYFLFTWLIQVITNNYLVTAFVSMVLLFTIGFLILWKLGKQEHLSKLKRAAFFSFYFLNAIPIGDYIRLGRMPELFAWVTFLGFATTLFYFRNKKLNKYFFLTSILYAVILISHQTVAILASVLWISIFLAQKEKLKVIAGFLLGVLLSSWWTVRYFIASQGTSTYSYVLSRWLFDFKVLIWTNIAAMIIPLGTLILFYGYIKDRDKNELLFFAPPMIITSLVLLRVVPFIPILKFVYPDPYLNFILFFGLFFLLTSNYKSYNKLIAMVITVVIIVGPIAGVAVNIVKTPRFVGHGEVEENAIMVLKEVNGRFLMVHSPYETLYSKAFFAYAPIYHGKITAGGWNEQFKPKEYNQRIIDLDKHIERKDCDKFEEIISSLNVTEVITFNDHCETLISCGWNKKSQKGNVCLFEVKGRIFTK